jgi:hypothetical protein
MNGWSRAHGSSDLRSSVGEDDRLIVLQELALPNYLDPFFDLLIV